MLMNSVKGSTKAQGFPLTLHDVMGDSRNTGLQPYKYLGKELDRTHGLDWYDHGTRHYDPVTGRWNVMDALAEKYYPWSPYVSCGDDPVNAVDPDGKEDYRVNKQGQFYKQKSMWEQIKSFFGCNTKKDRVFMEDTDELLAEFEEGTIMELEKQDIEFQNGTITQTSMHIKNRHNSEKLFRILGERTEVEWAQIEMAQGDNIILTDKDKREVSSSLLLIDAIGRKGGKVAALKHTHKPTLEERNGNMGDFIDIGPSPADLQHASNRHGTIFVVYNYYTNTKQYYDGKGIYKQVRFR